MTLIWHNRAAELFLAKLKKHGLKLAPPAVPIKGQIARNIRLGSPGRTSLARIQFLAGEKPTSCTCATTPLVWQDGQNVLLIVGVDPIPAEILAAADDDGAAAPSDGATLPLDAVPVADTPEGTEFSQAEPVMPAQAPEQAGVEHGTQDGDPAGEDVATWRAEDDHGTAEPETPFAPPPPSADGLADADENAYARELDSWRAAERDATPGVVIAATDAEQQVTEPAEEAAPITVSQTGANTAAPGNRLSRLVNRLAGDAALYTPLSAADDTLMGMPQRDVAEQIKDERVAAEPGAFFKVTGRGFIADQDAEPEEQSDAEADLADLQKFDEVPPAEAEADATDQLNAALAEIAPPPATDSDIVERVSRYNFDELSRILNDRVGEVSQPARPSAPAAEQSASLISLGGETLVLNRLPLGILVFRDQHVLFANRAITEMASYDSVETLRQAGLGAVFPAAGPEGQDAGPVNHLVQRDGTLVPVTARLQSISWRGRPALMLSASATEVRTGHEGAVNAFAQSLADVRGDGFFEITRAGAISSATPRASALLGHESPLDGRALSNLISSGDVAELRAFLNRPTRFAETARPWLRLQSAKSKAEVTLFAQGQAGVVTGYFGLVRGRDATPVRLAEPVDADPALLARLGRGIRRPLNSIIGFSDLMQSSSGTADMAQLKGYARDINAAGQDIAVLVDELEDYARLRDGRYLPQRASIDLTEMLESCVLRIRQQASNARVFVRNAISETLPLLTADRASLEQAVLNLLASAIDRSPNGGAVVISAQREDDGGIAVHVRDNSVNVVDMAERFVVFREGPDRDGKMLTPARSSVGLALTRSLLAINAFSLSVDPAGERGMLFTLKIPADLVENAQSTDVAE
ncbi:MAG: HAMP domain-containing histidine kinase [Candidatus Devosia euplotis]|nr:HAMP domain-containing histidine kinase [Candidatus Devosia euplotis]